MTISTTASTTTVGGNGVTYSFSFSFVVPQSSDISIIYTDASGVETTLSNSQYTLSLNPIAVGQLWSVGGTVTYPLSGAPIDSGTTLTITRILPLTQTTSISNQGDFYPESVEEALDTLCMEVQQVSGRTGQIRGIWITDVYYNYADIVTDGVNGNDTGNLYMCAIPNTSGVWADDLAAGDWILALNVQTLSGYLPLSGGTITGNLTVTGSSTLANAGPSSFISTGSSTSRTLSNRGADVIYTKDFGCVADGVADDTAALGSILTYLNTLNVSKLPRVVFNNGIYNFTSFPNFAISYLSIEAEGEVRLRNTSGSGASVRINGSSVSPNGCTNLTFGSPENYFIIEGKNTSAEGFRADYCNHCNFYVNVRGCGTSSAAVSLLSCVCTNVWPIASANDAGGWYDSGIPLVGVLLDRFSVPLAQSSFCNIFNPVIEGVQFGLYFAHAFGNNVWGGTSESNFQYGVYFDSGSENNKIFGTDFEANATNDVLFAAGEYNKLVDCFIAGSAVVAASCIQAQIQGGEYGSITIANNATAILNNFGYNQANDSSVITDNNTNPFNVSRVGPIINIGTGAVENISLSAINTSQFDKTSDASLADITGLSVPVVSGKKYTFVAILSVISGASGGIKVAIGGTATATSITYTGHTYNGATLTSSKTTTKGNSVGAVTSVTTDVEIVGTIVVNAGGTLTVQAAQNASNGTATSVLINSSFVVTQISGS